ncbi:MAG: ThiF family adenylyltransferase [Clostridia bacterium]|nr:ThiF family adenylyltransferase [Clostridia bacterium]
MKLSLDRPVKIVVIGAGGTGGYVIPHLYRIAYASGRPCRIIIADGDIVEQKNLIRQNFAECDIGENKAQVMAERYSEVFGIETEYIPDFIENEQQLLELLRFESSGRNSNKPISILIGAVDNNRSRIMCNNVFKKLDDIIYIDSGNGEFTGQVICGVKMSGRVISKPVASVYPDLLKDTEKFPSELSCAERSVSAPQSIAANVFASSAVISMLYHLLIEGNLRNNRITFSSRKLLMKTVA